MHDILAADVRRTLGTWTKATLLTDRRGAFVWHVRMTNGAQLAVKAALGGPEAGPEAVLPAREAAVIRAAGTAAGSTVLASGTLPDGGSWLATPWWHGATLRKRFADARRSPNDNVLRHLALHAAAKAADTIGDLHDAGWAHGDIQSQHVFDTPSGIRLIDHAWAHGPNGALPEHLDVPYHGTFVHFEAPETAQRLLDEQPATPTPGADVYAFGAVLWSSWTTTWPVDYAAAGVDTAPGNLAAKRQAVASGRWHRPVADLDWSDFGTLLAAPLSARPEHRPTARTLASRLRDLARRQAMR